MKDSELRSSPGISLSWLFLLCHLRTWIFVSILKLLVLFFPPLSRLQIAAETLACLTLIGISLDFVCKAFVSRLGADLHLTGEGTRGEAARKLEMRNNTRTS